MSVTNARKDGWQLPEDKGGSPELIAPKIVPVKPAPKAEEVKKPVVKTEVKAEEVKKPVPPVEDKKEKDSK